MRDLLPLFGEDEPQAPVSEQLVMMTSSQRAEIRELFAKLKVATAREQFATVASLTGLSISNVAELTASDAQTLIHRLRGSVKNLGRVSMGNSWDDRDEDTWIDRL